MDRIIVLPCASRFAMSFAFRVVMVDRTGSWVFPFIASIVLLLVGAVLASRLRPDKPFVDVTP